MIYHENGTFPVEYERWGVENTLFLALIFHEKLLSSIMETLDSPAIRYTGQSDLKVWRKQPASGWHRDSVSYQYGVGTEWSKNSNEYKVVRVAFYLQPWEDNFLPLNRQSVHAYHIWTPLVGDCGYEHSPWDSLRNHPHSLIGFEPSQVIV